MVRLSTAFAQFLLAISYIWSISALNSYRHKRFSLSFYNFCVGALSAGLGVLRYGNPLLEASVVKADERVLQLAHNMYPALVGIEFLMLHWPVAHPVEYFTTLAVFTCVVAATFWIYENQSTRRKWSLLTLHKDVIRGPAFSVSLAMVVCLMNNNFQGSVASVFLALNAIFVGTTGSVFEMPARDLYSYIQCFCNYHVVRALVMD